MWVFVCTILSGTLNTKLALDVWVKEDALFTVGARREELAVFFRVDVRAVLVTIHTIWIVFASDQLFLCSLGGRLLNLKQFFLDAEPFHSFSLLFIGT